MSAESFKRKLTAILSADVKGYGRLMGENEAETVKTLTAYRKIMDELTQQHQGRIIDSPGDNILAEFASVVDAVQCAVAAQNEFKARNADLPENRKMQFRIGINLGDVIEEGERIYGDGVNIAARLEAIADPGGICISKTAFDQKERIVFPLPNKPSIVILPFVNMSDDPQQEFFSDGLTEEIITALSKTPKFSLDSFAKTLTYKDQSVVDQRMELLRKAGLR